MTQGETIKLLRIKNKFSQNEFAKKTGISSNYLSLIENNKRIAPMSYLKKAADVLGISVNLLVWEKVDFTKFKTKESKLLAKKINDNLVDIKRLLFNQMLET